MHEWRRPAAALLSLPVLLLAACTVPPSTTPKEQIKLDLAVSAGAAVNPDDQDRASPVLVRVYELKTESTFQGADYFSLDKNDKTVLTQDMLARDEFILRPGESRDIERKLNRDTTTLGILVGYRDLAKATWRTVYKLPPAPEVAWYRAVVPARKVKLQVVLDQQSITVSQPD
ncbi:type VI secretion system-associated lipoprotein [Cupriavidus sp. USMAA2-4]|uniref:Type VI secretion system-associated lipoprotein n=1 Tax=Cupriavidus malaysiensis TaxID=367825 RepID=A0ABN4TG80_9BURK|nr:MULTISPECIES: type VI secretion system lipoprotein TssJ [Cupriavidus]AOY90871.1 type VI secretion system-associated lipoprotein [Cupriavidus sp. USMAA2-4]AOZ06172.1 type VI secretion system-associated lipoprotein [Cupriavidus malaysiensis]